MISIIILFIGLVFFTGLSLMLYAALPYNKSIVAISRTELFTLHFISVYPLLAAITLLIINATYIFPDGYLTPRQKTIIYIFFTGHFILCIIASSINLALRKHATRKSFKLIQAFFYAVSGLSAGAYFYIVSGAYLYSKGIVD